MLRFSCAAMLLMRVCAVCVHRLSSALSFHYCAGSSFLRVISLPLHLLPIEEGAQTAACFDSDFAIIAADILMICGVLRRAMLLISFDDAAMLMLLC